MDKKTTGIVAYLSWIGWLIAYLLGDREHAKFHLNQGLVLNLAFSLCALIAKLTCLGSLLSIFVFVLWMIGFVAAIQDEEKPVPFLGEIFLLK